jgi:hypothetical protein
VNDPGQKRPTVIGILAGSDAIRLKFENPFADDFQMGH